MNILEIFKSVRCGHKEFNVSLKKFTTYKLDTIASLIVKLLVFFKVFNISFL